MKCYIWSNQHEAWWKPNRMGYTLDRKEAGIYPLPLAMSIVIDANKYQGDNDIPDETIVPIEI